MIAFLTTDAAGYMTGGLRGRRLNGPLGQNRVERPSAQLRVDRKRRDLDLRARRCDPRVASAELSGPPAWKTIPSWYLIATEDRAIPPATQRFMAERSGATIAEVRASHVPMNSRPSAVTDLILQAADAVD